LVQNKSELHRDFLKVSYYYHCTVGRTLGNLTEELNDGLYRQPPAPAKAMSPAPLPPPPPPHSEPLLFRCRGHAVLHSTMLVI
jgi:hypothetical protein